MEEEDDERPPICPACGVTMGMVAEGAETRFVCWECGFGEDEALPADGE
jgi:ribosomal protein S27AE